MTSADLEILMRQISMMPDMERTDLVNDLVRNHLDKDDFMSIWKKRHSKDGERADNSMVLDLMFEYGADEVKQYLRKRINEHGH